MIDQLILPLSTHSSHLGYLETDEECSDRISTWINTRVGQLHKAWPQSPVIQKKYTSSVPADIAEEIAAILTHRTFNFQSKRNLISLLPSVRENIERQVRVGAPIKLFYLYNGGYRASSFPDRLSLIFEPDQTELMLLYQIALLNKKIIEVYAPGIDFFIVINNGVAHWVNDIPLVATQEYASRLRRLIDLFGAANKVQVLLQSEFASFNSRISFGPIKESSLLSEKEHKIVERFLGRGCSRSEALHRAALYKLAEAKWGEEISSVVDANDGLMLRQVAHPDMLSFRPFPGGAIRSQNGSFGFLYRNNELTPKLITSESIIQYGVKCVPYSFPWSRNYNYLNTVEQSDA